MMITKNEYLEALDILKEQHSYLASNMHFNYPFSTEMLKRVQNCFENLIEEHEKLKFAHFSILGGYDRLKKEKDFYENKFLTMLDKSEQLKNTLDELSGLLEEYKTLIKE